MTPYSANPTLWWLLLNEFSKFIKDSTAPPVARRTAATCKLHWAHEEHQNYTEAICKKTLSASRGRCKQTCEMTWQKKRSRIHPPLRDLLDILISIIPNGIRKPNEDQWNNACSLSWNDTLGVIWKKERRNNFCNQFSGVTLPGVLKTIEHMNQQRLRSIIHN